MMSDDGSNSGNEHLDADDAAFSADEKDNSTNESTKPTAGTFSIGESKNAGVDPVAESKRKKRLELNRKAAKESRERKKKRVEALNNNIVTLTRENYELRTHNEDLRYLIANGSVDDPSILDHYQAENALLRLAVYECVENLVHARHPKSASLFLAPGIAEPKQLRSNNSSESEEQNPNAAS